MKDKNNCDWHKTPWHYGRATHGRRTGAGNVRWIRRVQKGQGVTEKELFAIEKKNKLDTEL